MKLSAIRSSGHWPTLLASFLYFDASFMVWTMLGALGTLIAPALGLDAEQKFLMIATPTLAGALLRIALGLLADRFGTKLTGVAAQLVVIAGMAIVWRCGLSSLAQALVLGVVLGVAGASFAVALPQAGRWYPPQMQGFVLGVAGAGNIGVVIDHLAAPRIAAHFGWQAVFGAALVPLVFVLLVYVACAKEAPGKFRQKRLSDYIQLLGQGDAHWFCFFYTISFGGFVGLATAFAIYFHDVFGLAPVAAGEFAAFCTLVGAVGRPFGGAVADRCGGIRALGIFFSIAGAALVMAALAHNLWVCGGAFFVASGAFGMCNGSIFQLLPQRFAQDMGVMTGLVGCGGGIGGFLLGVAFGASKQNTGSYVPGILVFATLCGMALIALQFVKYRWRATWGALATVPV